MRVEWLPEADQDLTHQLDYIAERNPGVAVEMGDAVHAAVARLKEFPESGRPGRVAGTRELVITGTPFIVFYRIEPKAVVVMHLLHVRRKWPRTQ